MVLPNMENNMNEATCSK